MLKRGRKLFEKKFFFPVPHLSKTLKPGFVFYHIFCAQRLNAECSHCTHAGKFWSSFFKSLRGFGASSPIITALSFCQAFSLRLSCQRKSGIIRFYVFFVGKGNFLKEAFLSPHPYPSRTLKLGFYFFIIISALDGRTHNVRTVPKCESF